MKTKYCYGYVRVSTSGQEELSPDSQAKLLKDFAKKNDMIILQIFYELGISGRKADKRPECSCQIRQTSCRLYHRMEIQPFCQKPGRIYRL